MEENLRKKVLEHIDEDEVIRVLKDILSIPCFAEEENEMAKFIANYLEKHGIEVELQEVEKDRLQVLGRIRGTGEGPTLMFNGHMETDPIGIGWDRDPWIPIVKEGRIYGPGVWNMQSGVAAMIMAAVAIKRSGIPLKGDLLIAAVVGEIQGGVGTQYLIKKGIIPDMAVIPEPTALSILTKHAGVAEFAIHTIGYLTHISSLEKGINAIEKMMKVIEVLRSIEWTYKFDPELPGLPRMLVSTIIGGRGREYELRGSAFVPDFCTIIVNVRFNASQSPESLKKDVIKVLEGLKTGDPEFRYELQMTPDDYTEPPIPFRNFRLNMPSLDLPRDEYIVQVVKKNHKYVTGSEVENIGPILEISSQVFGEIVPYTVSYAGTDCGHLWKAGAPSICYGPGGEAAWQRPPEKFVRVDEVITCTKVLALTALDVCTRSREETPK